MATTTVTHKESQRESVNALIGSEQLIRKGQKTAWSEGEKKDFSPYLCCVHTNFRMKNFCTKITFFYKSLQK